MMMSDAAVHFTRVCGLQPFEVGRIAETQKVPVSIILGLAKAESGGKPGAMRYEDGYPYLFHVEHFAGLHGWTEDTETMLQRISWGLCQIMLATARERGFGLHPQKLLEPIAGLTWGAYHLSELFLKHKTWPAALSAYNQGSPKKNILTGKFKNQKYVDTVQRYAREFTDVPPTGNV